MPTYDYRTIEREEKQANIIKFGVFELFSLLSKNLDCLETLILTALQKHVHLIRDT